MSNADFDTRNTSPGTRPTTAKAAENGRKHPSIGRPISSTPGNRPAGHAQHHHPPPPATAQNPRIYGRFTVSSARPAGPFKRAAPTSEGKWIKGTRYSLLKDTAKQTTKQLLKLAEVVTTNKRMYRAFLLHGELRYLYKVPKHEARERLEAWLAWASRSRLKPFVKLARTIRAHKAGVLAAIELGISNGRLEALNSKVRLLSHRAYGFHSANALIAMIYLCCAGITIALPHR